MHCGHPYGDFLWQLQEELPALTFVGYTDAAGRAYSHLETNDFTARIEDYQRLQYNNLFGGQDRLAAFFDPEAEGNRRLTKETAAWLPKGLLFGYTGRQRGPVPLGQRIQAGGRRVFIARAIGAAWYMRRSSHDRKKKKHKKEPRGGQGFIMKLKAAVCLALFILCNPL